MLIWLAPLRYPAERFSPPGEDGIRRRTVFGWLLAATLSCAWLPASTAVFGAAAGPDGWLWLAAGGLPLGVACLVPGRRQPAAAWTIFLLLAPLCVLWCTVATTDWPAAQASGAAVLGLPAWGLAAGRRRRRSEAVWLDNAALLRRAVPR